VWVCLAISGRNLHDPPWRIACPTAAKFAPENRAKQTGKTGFPVNGQLLKVCVFCIAAAQHYCFQSGGTSLFSGSTIHRRLSRTVRERGTIMLAAIVRFFREWRRYNQSLRELSRLGDRELADIGISRSDIQRVAWNACHQR
jgi:uncharacterized protein YjiS (DUF1127 family)